MDQTRIHVVIPKDVVLDIDDLYGKGHRSTFLTHLAERELRKEKLLRALDDAKGCWKDEDHPELAKGSEYWVRDQRAGWDKRLPKND